MIPWDVSVDVHARNMRRHQLWWICKKFLPTISSGSTFVFVDKGSLSGMHGRVEPVVTAAWQRFNVHVSLITVLAANISGVSAKKCDDDTSWHRNCRPLLYGLCHIWIPFSWPLSTSHESASGARLKAYGRIHPWVKAQTKPLSNIERKAAFLSQGQLHVERCVDLKKK